MNMATVLLLLLLLLLPPFKRDEVTLKFIYHESIPSDHAEEAHKERSGVLVQAQAQQSRWWQETEQSVL